MTERLTIDSLLKSVEEYSEREYFIYDAAGNIIFSGTEKNNGAGSTESSGIGEDAESNSITGNTETQESLSYNSKDNTLQTIEDNRYVFDADGNLIDGILGKDRAPLTYDSKNHLAGYRSLNADGTVQSEDSYTYDCESYRVSTVNITEGTTVQTVYTYDRLNKDLLVSVTGGNTTKYIYGNGLIATFSDEIITTEPVPAPEPEPEEEREFIYPVIWHMEMGVDDEGNVTEGSEHFRKVLSDEIPVYSYVRYYFTESYSYKPSEVTIYYFNEDGFMDYTEVTPGNEQTWADVRIPMEQGATSFRIGLAGVPENRRSNICRNFVVKPCLPDGVTNRIIADTIMSDICTITEWIRAEEAARAAEAKLMGEGGLIPATETITGPAMTEGTDLISDISPVTDSGLIIDTEDAVEPSRNAGSSRRGELLYSGVDFGITSANGIKGIDPDRIIDNGLIGGPIGGPIETDPSSEPEETTDWTEKAGTITGYRYYTYDLRGSVTRVTDDKGDTVERYSYSTYGKRTTEYGDDTNSSSLGYCAREGVLTEQNSLIYMRARYYSPDLMRFINQDILVGDIGNSASLNRYCYVEGNPATNIDPFGLNPQRGDEDSSIWAKVDKFVSDNAVAIAIGTDVILIGATIVTGGATAPILVATLAGQGIGVVGGGTVSAIEYYLDNGTLSGASGQVIDESLKQAAYGGFLGFAGGTAYTSVTAYQATQAIGYSSGIAEIAGQQLEMVEVNAQEEVSKLSEVIEVLKSGQMTSDGHNIITQLDETSRVIFRMDVGEYAHKIVSKGYDVVNHINVEIQKMGQNGKYSTKWVITLS